VIGRIQQSKGFNIMKNTVLAKFSRFAAISAVAVLCVAAEGCRRTDVRDFEVSIPALTTGNEAIVRQALARFAGVDKASLKFDHKAKKLSLRYDSMQLAKKNIELEIAKAGLEANGVTPASVGK
jgi:hypothetical protein